MKYYDSTKREVDIAETDGGIEEAYIVSATYIDTGEDVPDNELDYLQNRYATELYEIELERMIGQAEAAYDAMMER